MRRISSTLVSGKLVYAFVIVSLLLGAGLLFVPRAKGAEIANRSLTLSDNIPGDTATYTVAFDIPTAGTLGSVKIEFCDNTPLFGLPCNPPPGFDVSGATLSGQTGETGFSIDGSTTANVLVLTRVPAATAGGSVSFTLSNVHNASALGSSYARYSTYQTNDASGPDTDDGGVAYALANALTVSAEVPPYLAFCAGITISGTDCTTATGDYMDLGDFSPVQASAGQSQLVAATNAQNGYTIRMNGPTMTSGNNLIPPLTVPTVSAPGTNQFGVNLRANADPAIGADPTGPGTGSPTANYNQQNRFTYNNGDVIAGNSGTNDFRKYTVSYLVNVSRSQSPGIYTSTFTFVALGNF